jgi:5'-methylthioadenosine phosphorylase
MQAPPCLAVIGGTGLYDLPGLENRQVVDLDTPFGKPSSPIVIGELEGRQVAFLARHGIGHAITPSEVNSRANLYALKSLGAPRVVSVSACGSLREDYHPGDIVIPDQLFDFTRQRARTFFEGGIAAHISVAEPFCEHLSQQAYQAVKDSEATVHFGGTSITIEGPRFSTRGESNVFRAWGMAIINMTTAPEAFLAREAELCYAVIAHVTDYDVWHISEQPVTVDMVIEILQRNIGIAQESIRNLVRSLPEDTECSCRHALASAILTSQEAVPAETRQRLDLLVGKYFK